MAVIVSKWWADGVRNIEEQCCLLGFVIVALELHVCIGTKKDNWN